MLTMWILFILYFAMYAVKIGPLWMVLSGWSVGLAIYLLVKNSLPSPKYIVISVGLALVAALSYFGYFHGLSIPATQTGFGVRNDKPQHC